MTVYSLAVLIIVIALAFDFLNGFHDAANSVATVVATRVLTPFQAVVWAAFFNFVAAFTFGTGVAKSVSTGFVNVDYITPFVIMAGLAGAIVWDILTWLFGLPTSSSHALIGGYAGAAMAHAAYRMGPNNAWHALVVGQWPTTILFMVAAPLLGLALAYILMAGVYRIFEIPPRRRWTASFATINFSPRASTASRMAPTTPRRPWASSPACWWRQAFSAVSTYRCG